MAAIASPCNFCAKNYTEIFSITYKRNGMFRKIGLDRSISMGQIVAQSLFFIAFYVRVLTSRLHWSEAVLQLSENVTAIVICRTETRVINKEG